MKRNSLGLAKNLEGIVRGEGPVADAGKSLSMGKMAKKRGAVTRGSGKYE